LTLACKKLQKEIVLKTPTNRELIMPTFEENLGSLMRALDQA
jgi:hypothetical protein